MSAVHIAASKGNIKFLSHMLTEYSESELKLDDKNIWGWTPMFHALINKHDKVVRFLLSKKCCVNTSDEQKKTMLQVCASYGNVDLLKILLEEGADIDAADFRGRTALYFAAGSGQREVLQLLISRGCNLDKRNDSNRTALLSAAFHNNKDCVEDLLEAGASCYVTKMSSTEIDIVQLLIKKILSSNENVFANKSYQILLLLLQADGGRLSDIHMQVIRKQFLIKPTVKILHLMKLLLLAGVSVPVPDEDTTQSTSDATGLWNYCLETHREKEFTLQQMSSRYLREHLYEIKGNVSHVIQTLPDDLLPKILFDKLLLYDYTHMDTVIRNVQIQQQQMGKC